MFASRSKPIWNGLAFFVTFALVVACTGKGKDVKEPLVENGWNLPGPSPVTKENGKTKPRKKKKRNLADKTLPEDAASAAAVTPKAPPLPPDPCKLYPLITSEPPFFIASGGIMLTRIVNSCVTREGERGYEEATSWLIMGFPCSGGGGKTEIKGNYYNPKLVSFVVGTNCPMAPTERDVLRKIVLQATGLSEKSQMMAHNPFAVQYWEIPSLAEADTGFKIELRSKEALGGLWRRMRDKGETLAVRLYGRENAWVQGDHIYQLDAELIPRARTFQLRITNAKSLTPEELQEVRGRCEELRPRRDCLGAF